MMHVHRSDLLTIESTSASKPSLLSSFWSINVQVQNNERPDLDSKACSQYSLPDVSTSDNCQQNYQTPQKPTRSLSVTDLNPQYEPACQSNIQKPQPLSMTKENATCRVADWITSLDINKV